MQGFPGGQLVKHLPAVQCRRPGFDPWVGKIRWRRARPPIPGFLLGESHGQRSLVGCSPRGHKELDSTERLMLACLSSVSAAGVLLCAFRFVRSGVTEDHCGRRQGRS